VLDLGIMEYSHRHRHFLEAIKINPDLNEDFDSFEPDIILNLLVVVIRF